MKVEFIEELNQVQSSLENLLQKAQFQESISESEETKKGKIHNKVCCFKNAD